MELSGCAGAFFCLALRLIGSTYVPIGAAGGEDACALVPGHTDGPLGARDRIRRCGPTRRWLRLSKAHWDRMQSTPLHRVQNVEPCPRLFPRVVAAFRPGRRVFHGRVWSLMMSWACASWFVVGSGELLKEGPEC